MDVPPTQRSVHGDGGQSPAENAGGPPVNRKTTSVIAALGAGILFATGCSGPQSESNAAESSDEGVIRFTFSPDPAWDWIQDQGILEEMEKDSGYRILQTVTWDEYGQFAGGHADVVSIGTYELQNLEQETGVKTVTFGKFNKAKDVMITANPQWETVSDMPKGCKIAAESVVGNAFIWGALIEKMDNRELAEGSDDLELVTADYQIIPDLVLNNEVCGAFADPTQSIPNLEACHGRVGDPSRRDHRRLSRPLRGGERGRRYVDEGLLREHIRLVRRLAVPHPGVDRPGEGNLPAAQRRRGGRSRPA
jgi:hypothetical protein